MKKDEELSKEQLERRNVLRQRMFWVFLGLIAVLIIYLLFEIVSIFQS